MSVQRAIAQITNDAPVRRIPQGQTIIRSNEQAVEVFVLKSGTVCLHPNDHASAERVLHLLGPHAIFPLFFLGPAVPITEWRYATLDTCELYVLSPEYFQARITGDEALRTYLITWLSTEQHKLLLRIAELQGSSASARMQQLLVYLATYHASTETGGWRRVTFPVSHRLLAALLGISRTNATRALQAFHTKEMVRQSTRRTLEINLRRLSQ